jgi:hypothetical protein
MQDLIKDLIVLIWAIVMSSLTTGALFKKK